MLEKVDRIEEAEPSELFKEATASKQIGCVQATKRKSSGVRGKGKHNKKIAKKTSMKKNRHRLIHFDITAVFRNVVCIMYYLMVQCILWVQSCSSL